MRDLLSQGKRRLHKIGVSVLCLFSRFISLSLQKEVNRSWYYGSGHTARNAKKTKQ